MQKYSKIQAQLDEIKERTSQILNNNWFFFSYFDREKNCQLSYEKVIGEFLIYSLFSKDKNLYFKVLKEDFGLDRCWQRLQELSTKYSVSYSYLKTNEKLDRKWITRQNENCYQELHVLLNRSEVMYEDDLYRCNYLDLYNFTHDIFWGLDFGNISLNDIFEHDIILEIFNKAIKNYYFSALCKHYDLASENIIVLLILLDEMDDKCKEKVYRIFNTFYVTIAKPILEQEYNFKENYKDYHTILVLGLLGNLYEYQK